MKLKFILLLMLAHILYAQAPSPKWVSVLSQPHQTVFVDTSSIKRLDTQISTLILTIYKKPVFNTSLNREIKQIKSQLLFNTASRRYSIIGTLYYDENLKIVGETTLPGLSIGNEVFELEIDSNEVAKRVFNRCLEKLGIILPPVQDEGVKLTSEVGKLVAPSKTKSPAADTVRGIPDREKLTKEFIEKKINEPVPDQPAVDKEMIPEPAKRQVKEDKATQMDVAKAEPAAEYDFKSEQYLQNTIFTDGKKFCLQVSSWKNRERAEKELARLKSAGHPAFITEAFIPNKGGTWYRVRIGLFNSLQEAVNYKEKM